MRCIRSRRQQDKELAELSQLQATVVRLTGSVQDIQVGPANVCVCVRARARVCV